MVIASCWCVQINTWHGVPMRLQRIQTQSSNLRAGAGHALLLIAALLASAGSVPAVTSAAVLGEGWLPGPGASGNSTYSGIIDAPATGTSVAGMGVVQLAGWFLDR